MAETWKVVSQRETSMVQAGSFVKAQEVTFETSDGDTGTVTVPLNQYTADAVAQAITERVATMQQVRGL